MTYSESSSSTQLARKAMKRGRSMLELIREEKVLTEAEIVSVLDPAAMTGQGRSA
jgi:aspartate ammonia-lyase